MSEDELKKAVVKHMVNRFLNWPLPIDFTPDNGISYDPVAGRGGPSPFFRQPTGTNLFTAMQAEKMVRYLLKNAPSNVKEGSN